MQKEYDVYKLIMLFDAAGNMVATNDSQPAWRGTPSIRNQAKHPWFNSRCIRGRAYRGRDLFEDREGKRAFLFGAGQGCRRDDLGVVTSRLIWSVVEKIIEGEKTGKTGYAYSQTRKA